MAVIIISNSSGVVMIFAIMLFTVIWGSYASRAFWSEWWLVFGQCGYAPALRASLIGKLILRYGHRKAEQKDALRSLLPDKAVAITESSHEINNYRARGRISTALISVAIVIVAVIYFYRPQPLQTVEQAFGPDPRAQPQPAPQAGPSALLPTVDQLFGPMLKALKDQPAPQAGPGAGLPTVEQAFGPAPTAATAATAGVNAAASSPDTNQSSFSADALFGPAPNDQSDREGPHPKDVATARSAPSPAFLHGQADRQQWEAWFASLSSEARAGAAYWADRRSLSKPGSCAASDRPPAWIAGCIDAQQRLASIDVRPKIEPDYRLGFNTRIPVAESPEALLKAPIEDRAIIDKAFSAIEEKKYELAFRSPHSLADRDDPTGYPTENLVLGVANCYIGEMYLLGQGVAKDLRKALMYFRKSFNFGNAEAQARLGNMYEDGKIVPRNLNEAIKLYRESANQGD